MFCRIESGQRALIEEVEGADPYAACLAKIEQLGVARHEIFFVGYRPGMLVFSIQKGRVWQQAPPLPALGDVKTWLKGFAQALGFPLVGLTSPVLPARYYERFNAWVDAGAHGDMQYIERQRAKRLQPALVMPTARSVLALATPYSPTRPGAIARYAVGRDYHELLSARMDLMKRGIRREFPGTVLYTSVDTGPVLERAYAEQAGLGWIGKNGVLISRTHGSYLSLCTLWTPFALELDTLHEEFCGTCTECLRGCPTQAITQPGYVEAPKCISYWTIEKAGEGTPDPHGWLFGCDTCQEVCPWNRFAAPVSLGSLQPLPEIDWVAASDADVQARIAQTPMRRAGVAGMRRNARRLLPVID